MLLGDKEPNQLLLQPQISQFSQFVGARRMYPATVIGIMAKWRDMYRNAESLEANQRDYMANPLGRSMPEFEAELSALYPVVQKTQPVAFKTEKMLDAQRALQLQQDLGFNMMLMDLREGWLMTDRLKAAKMPVFLSLELPKKDKDKEADDDKKQDTEAEKEETTKGLVKTVDDPIKGQGNFDVEYGEMLEKREAAYKQYYANAGEVAKAGIKFGFSGAEVAAKDIHKNLRLMIENGLTPEQALAALTTTPAGFFGMSNYAGTLEAGKMANVVADKPIFDEKAKVLHVLVNGDLFDYSDKKTSIDNDDDEKED